MAELDKKANVGISSNWLGDGETFEKYVFVQILSNIAVNPIPDDSLIERASRLALKAKNKFFK